MNRKLLGLTLAISAVLASTNISSAADSRWVNSETQDTWSGHSYENIDISNEEGYEKNLGAGILNSGTIKLLQENTYQNNKAVRGGALYNTSIIEAIENEIYSENSATSDGGAIFNAGTINSIKSTEFTKNTATGVGGAIVNAGTQDNQSVLNISECTFEANSAEYGGAIYNDPYGKIENLNADFSNNKATVAGGAIHNLGTINTIGGSFTSNSTTDKEGVGGALSNGGTIETINSNFNGNSAYSGGAIANVGTVNTISGKFRNNTAKAGGGAIITADTTNGETSVTANLKEIKNAEFTNNSTTDEQGVGGAILASQAKNKLTISSSSFNSNKAASGGAIANTGLLDVTNSTFTDNSASSYGGAISNYATKLSVNSSTFTNNSAQMGGAIYGESKDETTEGANDGVLSELEVTNSTFTNNSATTFGGAIGSDGKLTVKNSIFKNNKTNFTLDANESEQELKSVYTSIAGGGAIGVNDETDIESSSFDGNYSNVSGGAIIANGTNGLKINNSAFANNKADVNGGAIASGWDVSQNGDSLAEIFADTYTPDKIEITDTDFANNSAGKYGGAIYYSNGNKDTDNNPSLTINAKTQDVVFTNNKAEKGGDIYINNSVMNLNADTGRNIIFNSGVAGNGTINTKGAIVLNSEITPDNGNLLVNAGENSTIKASADKYINGIDLTLANGATLDLINGTIGTAKINNLTSNGGNIKIDMDLSRDDQIADLATISNATGTLNISGINLIADLKDDSVNSLTSDLSELNLGNLSVVTNDDLNILTNDYMYTVKVQDKNLKVDRLNSNGTATKMDGFTFAVNQNDKVNGQDITLGENRSFSATKDIEITGEGLEKGWTGSLGGTKLSVNGNGHVLNGADKTGITVGDGQTLEFTDTNITGFKTSEGTKGALTVKDNGNLNISAINHDVIIAGINAGQDSDGKSLDSNAIYLDGANGNAKATLTTGSSRKLVINDDIRSANAGNKITMQGNGTILFNGVVDPVTLTNENAKTIHNNQIKDVTYNLNSGMVGFSKDSYLSDNNNSINFNGGMLSVANGAVGAINLEALSLNSDSNIAVDADLANGKMDTISANTVNVTGDAKLNVSGINLISDATKDSTVINFVNDETLKSHVTSTVSEVAYSPIYKYGVAYDATEGNFEFTRGSAGNYNNVNPAVMVAPVAAQLGGYFTQLNAYDQAFSNMDLTMLMTKEQRQALKMYNKYAYNGDGFGSVSPYSGAIPEERGGLWARPYTSFESVRLKNGPKVSNVMYGTFFGGDSSIKEFRNGLDGVFSAYIGYNGSHQAFDGNSLWQNGGTVGLTGTLYKGNWFGGWTLATGVSGVDANTMYGSENFGMWSIGTALKTGYNWELLDNKFIIQPHIMASYSLVDTFNYTNAAGLSIHSDPLNAVQLAPGVRFIGNLKDGWQPYVGLDFMWNIMDKTKFDAIETSLPQLSVKPYIQYGIGVQKRWGERSTGYAQAMFRNIGRNGVIFSFGYRAAFGRGK